MIESIIKIPHIAHTSVKYFGTPMELKRRVSTAQDTGEIGQHLVSAQFVKLGWKAHSVSPDYGEDLMIQVADDGVLAGLTFLVQVKGTEDISEFQLKNLDYSYPIEVSDLNHWRDFLPPAVLILWDTNKNFGYWVTVDDAIKKLDKDNSGWQERIVGTVITRKGEEAKTTCEPKVQVHFPQANLLNSKTLTELRHKVAFILMSDFAKDKEMKINVQFSFPNDDEGKLAQENMKRFWDEGESVTISGKHIKSLETSGWHKRKFGEIMVKPTDSLKIEPLISNKVEKIRVNVFDENNLTIAMQILEVKAVQVGEKQIIFSNEYRPTPFFFKMVYRTSGQVNFTLSQEGAKSSASEELKACKFFEDAQQGTHIRIDMLTSPELVPGHRYLELPFSPDTEWSPSSSRIDFLKKLEYIESVMGVEFNLSDTPISDDDWKLAHRVYQIVTDGKIEYQFGTKTIKLAGGDSAEQGRSLALALVESAKSGESVKVKGQMGDRTVDLLGVSFSLGPTLYDEEGTVTQLTVDHLTELIASGEDILNFEYSLENGSSIEEYLQWLQNAPTITLPSIEDKQDRNVPPSTEDKKLPPESTPHE